MKHNYNKYQLFKYIIAVIILIFLPVSISEAYSCSAYSIKVPDSYKADAKSLNNFTTFIKGNMTIGISLEDNLGGDDISNYTEQQISDLSHKTIDSLDSKAGSGITNTSHELTTFSDMHYPCLHMIYEGSTQAYAQVYMDEYIITTENYKYTVVFSCNNKDELNDKEINDIKASFYANDKLIASKKQPANHSKLIIIFTILSIIVAGAGFCMIRYITRHNKGIK